MAQAGTVALKPHWQPLFHDPALHPLIGNAVINNRDLRVAQVNLYTALGGAWNEQPSLATAR
ncbi:hypothetical protein [Pseudomonas sp. MWU15-20650]|uniref:hypothetical protein n=1 Tax=Pseudomonas sp. MWU15-20650 TaxID=2933107 RepID=UPI00200D1644|nr:hypothetical protein [Pseudomonas sp. MWU15-20650]